MIAALVAVQLAVASSSPGAVTYLDVPLEVVRVSMYEWQDEASPVRGAAAIERHENRLIVRAVGGRRSLIVPARHDGACTAGGPFWWPPGDVERALDRRWRQTISASAPEPIEADFTGLACPEAVNHPINGRAASRLGIGSGAAGVRR